MPDDNKNRRTDRRADCVQFTCKYQQGRDESFCNCAALAGWWIEGSISNNKKAANSNTTADNDYDDEEEMFSKQNVLKKKSIIPNIGRETFRFGNTDERWMLCSVHCSLYRVLCSASEYEV